MDKSPSKTSKADSAPPRLVAFCLRLQRRYLPAGSLRRSLVSGSFWSVAGAVLSRGFTLAIGILIARRLGKAGYGQWGVIVTAVSVFAQFSSFGISLIATKHVAEFKLTDPKRAGRILSFVMAMGLITLASASLGLVLLARWLALLYNAPELAGAFMLGGLILFTQVGTTMLQGALAGFGDFRGIAAVNLVQGSALFFVAVPLTWWWGLQGALIAMVISWGAGLLLCVRVVVVRCRAYGMTIRFRGIWQERRMLWHYSIPSVLTSGIAGPTTMLAQAMVARLPGGMAGLGGFQAAFRMQQIVLFIPGAVRRVTLPMLSELQGVADRNRYVRALRANVLVNGGVALIGALPLAVLSPWIMSLYGKAFRQDWDLLVILVLAGVFQAINDVLTQVMASLGRVWFFFGAYFVWGVVLLVGSVLTVPTYGARGYTFSLAAATVLIMLINYIGARMFIQKKWPETRNSLFAG